MDPSNNDRRPWSVNLDEKDGYYSCDDVDDDEEKNNNRTNDLLNAFDDEEDNLDHNGAQEETSNGGISFLDNPYISMFSISERVEFSTFQNKNIGPATTLRKRDGKNGGESRQVVYELEYENAKGEESGLTKDIDDALDMYGNEDYSGWEGFIYRFFKNAARDPPEDRPELKKTEPGSGAMVFLLGLVGVVMFFVIIINLVVMGGGTAPQPSEKGVQGMVDSESLLPPGAEIERTDEIQEKLNFNGDLASKILPNVLLIGAQRSGTTSVANYLEKNGVCHGKSVAGEEGYYGKSVHFFDIPNRFQQGVDFYSEHYRHCDPGSSLVLDATPWYLLSWSKITSFYPAAHHDLPKIFMILREPIAKEFSYYNQMLYSYKNLPSMREQNSIVEHPETGKVMNFDQYADLVILPSIEKVNLSLYAKYLKEWFQLLRVDQRHSNFLVMSHEELENDAPTALGRLQQFLGHSDQVWTGELAREAHVDFDSRVGMPSCATQEKLAKAFEPWNQDLYKLLDDFPGPIAEQRPFPKFQLGPCFDHDQIPVGGEQP